MGILQTEEERAMRAAIAFVPIIAAALLCSCVNVESVVPLSDPAAAKVDSDIVGP